MKRYLKMLFLICCIVVCSFSVHAEELVDGSALTKLSEVKSDTRTNARGVYLSYGSARLTDQGNHTVNVWGSTTCYKTSDQVKVTLYLQRLVGGNWSTVTTLSTKIAYNDYYVSNSRNVTVTGGYYYRIKGTHTAIKGSTTETTTSVTDGMWVSK